jgi:hypothetical protein
VNKQKELEAIADMAESDGEPFLARWFRMIVIQSDSTMRDSFRVLQAKDRLGWSGYVDLAAELFK